VRFTDEIWTISDVPPSTFILKTISLPFRVALCTLSGILYSSTKMAINYKRSQVWFFDLVIGLSIFIAALAVYYTYLSSSIAEDSTISNILSDGITISSTLLGGGYPSNWTNDTIVRLGITDNNHRVNHSKIIKVLNLSYPSLRSILNTRYDFFVFFRDSNGCLLNLSDNIYGIGHEGVGLDESGSSNCQVVGAKNITVEFDDINFDKLIKVERLVVYDSSISRMVVYLWA